jgi:hypothetical protein
MIKFEKYWCDPEWKISVKNFRKWGSLLVTSNDPVQHQSVLAILLEILFTIQRSTGLIDEAGCTSFLKKEGFKTQQIKHMLDQLKRSNSVVSIRDLIFDYAHRHETFTHHDLLRDLVQLKGNEVSVKRNLWAFSQKKNSPIVRIKNGKAGRGSDCPAVYSLRKSVDNKAA